MSSYNPIDYRTVTYTLSIFRLADNRLFQYEFSAAAENFSMNSSGSLLTLHLSEHPKWNELAGTTSGITGRHHRILGEIDFDGGDIGLLQEANLHGQPIYWMITPADRETAVGALRVAIGVRASVKAQTIKSEAFKLQNAVTKAFEKNLKEAV